MFCSCNSSQSGANLFFLKRGKIMKFALTLAALCISTSAFAAVPRIAADMAPVIAQEAQYSREHNRAIRRCMRQTYGPRYFRGVRTQHRMAMLRACGVS
jgi:hypothetical protein